MTPATEALARAMVNHSSRVDVPHPSDPGVRVVGFAYLEGQAWMSEALLALDAIASACSRDLQTTERKQRSGRCSSSTS